MNIIYPPQSQVINNNVDAAAFYNAEIARIALSINNNNMMCHAKGAFVGISSLSGTGVAITGASVALAGAGVAGGMLVLGIFGIIGLGIVAVTASIIWWVILANQSDAFKIEKEAAMSKLQANVLHNIAKDPAYYRKHNETTSV